MKKIALSLILAGAMTAPALAVPAHQAAPAFTLPTDNGAQISLASLRGKPVYLNFFASWCPPCNDEAASVEATAREYAKDGVTVIGIDEGENASAAAAFAEKYGFTFPVLVDANQAVGDAYGVAAIPQSVFIDADGVVQDVQVGELDASQMAAGIQTIDKTA